MAEWYSRYWQRLLVRRKHTRHSQDSGQRQGKDDEEREKTKTGKRRREEKDEEREKRKRGKRRREGKENLKLEVVTGSLAPLWILLASNEVTHLHRRIKVQFTELIGARMTSVAARFVIKLKFCIALNTRLLLPVALWAVWNMTTDTETEWKCGLIVCCGCPCLIEWLIRFDEIKGKRGLTLGVVFHSMHCLVHCVA